MGRQRATCATSKSLKCEEGVRIGGGVSPGGQTLLSTSPLLPPPSSRLCLTKTRQEENGTERGQLKIITGATTYQGPATVQALRGAPCKYYLRLTSSGLSGGRASRGWGRSCPACASRARRPRSLLAAHRITTRLSVFSPSPHPSMEVPGLSHP